MYWGNNWAKSLSAKVFCSRIIRVVTSTEFCQAIFDEGDIREGLGGCVCHEAMIPSAYGEQAGPNFPSVR